MLLGCLTYSHRLCMSRGNHNILWPESGKSADLRIDYCAACGTHFFATPWASAHALARIRPSAPGRFGGPVTTDAGGLLTAD
jgi:hypothetical protein